MPVFDERGEIAAVLDLDSRLPANFDDADRDGLERLVRALARRLTHRPDSALPS